MTVTPQLQAVETEMGLRMKQLDQVRSEQSKLVVKEGELRIKLRSLQHKRARLVELEKIKGLQAQEHV
jgi:hypothetical protein